MPIFKTLKDTFGFDSFREGQEEAIRRLLDEESVLAIFPTGSGKSLCYQLTALHLDNLTVVVSPLIALMKDQIDFLKKRGISAARLDSSLSVEEVHQIHSDLRNGKLKLLYIAPERLSNERFIQQLQQLPIDLMVIDEAHCISEWGHNFRPDYLKLTWLARHLKVGRVLALTATATPNVAADISREFAIDENSIIHTGFYRPNLELRATPCQSDERIKLLIERLKKRPAGSAIVYVTLQRTAEEVANELENAGLKARAYHAGMKNDLREEAQEWFMASPNAIIVATIAFGMGIDKADIRYVYHYNLPKSLENYSQEIGRAGRDGRKSICEVFANNDDLIVLENFTYGDTPEPTAIEATVESILKHEGDFDLSTYELSRKHDLRPLVVSTLLTYLELADAIEATGPFYSQYQFVPLRSSREILNDFDEQRADFLRKMFANATKAQKWFTLNLSETAERIGTDRDRLVRALNHLEENGYLTLKVSGLRLGYRIKSPPENLSNLKKKLIERFQKREKNDLLRVRQILEFTQSNSCLARKLLHHFGENMEKDCGHCDRCLGEAESVNLPISSNQKKLQFSVQTINELRQKHPETLASPRQIARFLCGLTSPFLTRDRLTRHPLFGKLSDVSFKDVKSAATEMIAQEVR